RIPLTGTGVVSSVTLHWAERPFGAWLLGRAAEFSLGALRSGTNTYLTNFTALTSTGAVQVIPVQANADELFLQLDRHASGVDFYSLSEVEVSGTAISLPVATILPGGGDSQLNLDHPIVSAVDGNMGTTWASGPESQVQ